MVSFMKKKIFLKKILYNKRYMNSRGDMIIIRGFMNTQPIETWKCSNHPNSKLTVLDISVCLTRRYEYLIFIANNHVWCW